MTKRKRNNYHSIIIGLLIIVLGFFTLSSKHIYAYYLNKESNEKIEEFFEQEENHSQYISKEYNNKISAKKDRYIGVLEMPSINLKRGFVDINSKYNTVKKNIQILKGSDMPDQKNGNFIIAAHAGTSRISFFKNLPKLKINDQAIVYYKNKIYKYELVNTYEINKTGVANIVKEKDKSVMTLITCKTKTNKQLVFVFELQEIL